MKKVKVLTQNQTKEVFVTKGTNLLNALIQEGFVISADCSGKGTCMKCLVSLNNEDVLACQTTIFDDCVVELNQLNIEKGYDFLKTKEVDPKHSLGIACDIGTTSIACYLVDLEDFAICDYYTDFNHQVAFGADVITRIDQCGLGNLPKLHHTIINQLVRIVEYFEIKHNLSEIKRMFVSCNTTMAHLLAGVDPSPLGIAPFTPVFTHTFLLENTKLNSYITNIVILPSVSAYLGSDILAGVLASRMLETNKNALLVDIGTNGEIILKTGHQLYGCSTAAGPAFEGAKISCGMGAVSGAINQVQVVDGKIKLKTVAGKPKGICGSGLVDTVAIMLEEKLLDESGAIQKSKSPLSKKIKNAAFYLNNEIYLSQKDIREFQLAKSAIISGILSMAKLARIDLEQIETVYLAGGFGFYLNLDHAFSVGLLPKVFKGKVRSIGNASGMGAKMCLTHPENIARLEQIAKSITTIELSNSSAFFNYFTDNMSFGREE